MARILERLDFKFSVVLFNMGSCNYYVSESLPAFRLRFGYFWTATENSWSGSKLSKYPHNIEMLGISKRNIEKNDENTSSIIWQSRK